MADAEEEFAFRMQVDELLRVNRRRLAEEPEPVGQSQLPQEWDDYFMVDDEDRLGSAPSPMDFVQLELDKLIVQRTINESLKRSDNKSVFSPTGMSDRLSFPKALVPSSSEGNVPNLRAATPGEEDIEQLLLEEALLLSRYDEPNCMIDSEDLGFDSSDFEPPAPERPHIPETSKLSARYEEEQLDKVVGDLEADMRAPSDFYPSASGRRLFASENSRYEREQLEKIVGEIESEMLAKEQHQVWQDELLARLIDNQNPDGRVSSTNENQVYDLFYAEGRDERGFVGLGCVMKDGNGHVVFENRECVGTEISHHAAEYTALTNGLAYARSTGVKRINAHGNPAFLYCEVKGLADIWTAEQLKLLEALQEQVKELHSFNVDCISKAENKDAINLAKYAIELHVAELKKKQKTMPLWKGKTHAEEDIPAHELWDCLICYEKIHPSDIVLQKMCDHQFCFNCLSQHVENEIQDSKVPVRCPQFFLCSSHMGLYDCQHFLCPKLFDTYARRLTEATISDLEKVYCPFPNCSAMMCRNDGRTNTFHSTTTGSSSQAPELSLIGGAECVECHRFFCVECQVPWHGGLTCKQYQELPPGERDAEDIKLFRLAKDENWRRCKQCRRMIILSHGCFHMTCRCGYEFCYTCETQYVNKKKMCKCPLFRVREQ